LVNRLYGASEAGGSLTAMYPLLAVRTVFGAAGQGGHRDQSL